LLSTAVPYASPFTQVSQPGSLYFRHPDYLDRWWWREFNRISYLGGREYYQPRRLTIEFWAPAASVATRTETGQLIMPESVSKAYNTMLFRHSREQEWEFFNRLKRAHYYNPVRTAVNMLVSHATKKGVTRDKESSPELEAFWSGVDCERKQDIDAFMRDGLRWAQVGGLRWACVDVDSDPGGDGKPYAYWVDPADIMDWSMGEDGQIEWLKQFVSSEAPRKWSEEIAPIHTWRIWYRDKVEEFQCDGRNGRRLTEEPKVTPNALGRVPFVPLFSPQRISESDFPDAEPLITDFAKAANSVYNYVSLLNDLAYKQTFSLLCVPDPNVNVIEVGTNTVFGWNAASAGGSDPMYIAPDAEQPRVIMELLVSCLEQMRQCFGIGRGRQEGSMQKSSADALELESEDKRSILADIASAAEDFEKQLALLVMSYKSEAKKDLSIDDLPHIQYSQDFDVNTFQQEMDELLTLQSIGLSPEVEEKFRSDLVARKLAGMPPEELAKLLDSLKGVVSPAQKQAEVEAQAALTGTPVTGRGSPKPNQAGKPGQGNGSPNPGKATGAAEPGTR
jgi:hypothetical protein